MKNITAGFKATGIYPLNLHIFGEDEFLLAVVTDIPLIEDSVDVSYLSSDSLIASTSSLQAST